MQLKMKEGINSAFSSSILPAWIRGAAACAMLALPTISFAEGPGWSNVSTVIKLVNTAAGSVNVQLSPLLTGCTSQSGYGPAYASIYPDHPGINRIKADLLTAMLTGAKVQIYFMDSTCRVGETILLPP